MPSLDLLLSSNRAFHRLVNFKPEETLYSLSSGEPLGDLFAVLPDAARKARSYTCVQSSMKATGQQIARNSLHLRNEREGRPRVKPGVTELSRALARARGFAEIGRNMDGLRSGQRWVEPVVDHAGFQHALDVAAGLFERDFFDPADDVDIAARIAIGVDPLADVAGTGVIARDRQRIIAVPGVDQPPEIGAPQHDVVAG